MILALNIEFDLRVFLLEVSENQRNIVKTDVPLI